jgi:hypothetical protein
VQELIDAYQVAQSPFSKEPVARVRRVVESTFAYGRSATPQTTGRITIKNAAGD